MPNVDLRSNIADALRVGHGTAGTVLQGSEAYIIADTFVAAHVDDKQREHDMQATLGA